MRPECCITIVRQMARPRPVPPFCRESEASTCWKRPKIALQLVGRNSASVIDHGKNDACDAGPQHHADRRVGRRKLDGVGEQVGDDLKQAIGIGGRSQPWWSRG